jgi:hypothetical protein
MGAVYTYETTFYGGLKNVISYYNLGKKSSF